MKPQAPKNSPTLMEELKPESLAYLADSINPEAGRHPVPADVREMQASLLAMVNPDKVISNKEYPVMRFARKFTPPCVALRI